MSLEFKIIFCNESTRRSNFVAQLSRIQGGRCPRGVGNREILFYLTSLHSPSDLKTQTFQPSPLSLSLREGVKESGYSTVRLTVAFVKILGLKTHWIWFLDTQNTFYLMVKGLKNAYLMHFSSLPSRFCCSVCYYLQCSCSLSQRVKQRVKKLFFGQNLFQLMYNHKQKSNAPLRKKTQMIWP